MSPSDEENENHNSSHQLGAIKNCSPFMVKSTISSTIDAT